MSTDTHQISGQVPGYGGRPARNVTINVQLLDTAGLSADAFEASCREWRAVAGPYYESTESIMLFDCLYPFLDAGATMAIARHKPLNSGWQITIFRLASEFTDARRLRNVSRQNAAYCDNTTQLRA